MTTNKLGSVNQQPLYVCTSCISRYEDSTWPAGDLRVHSGECWCYPCWDERRWDFPDQPSWNDLEPYTPALQAECEKLRKNAERYRWLCEKLGVTTLPCAIERIQGGKVYVADGKASIDAAIDTTMETPK